MPDQSNHNVYELGAFSADDMLRDIVNLRTRFVEAWRERAVMLTSDEQARLRQEIRVTCQMLGDLAPNS